MQTIGYRDYVCAEEDWGASLRTGPLPLLSFSLLPVCFRLPQQLSLRQIFSKETLVLSIQTISQSDASLSESLESVPNLLLSTNEDREISQVCKPAGGQELRGAQS